MCLVYRDDVSCISRNPFGRFSLCNIKFYDISRWCFRLKKWIEKEALGGSCVQETCECPSSSVNETFLFYITNRIITIIYLT